MHWRNATDAFRQGPRSARWRSGGAPGAYPSVSEIRIRLLIRPLDS
jgi:hypothetical protein